VTALPAVRAVEVNPGKVAVTVNTLLVATAIIGFASYFVELISAVNRRITVSGAVAQLVA